MTITIEIDNNKTAFAPGEEISGTVNWNLDKQPKKVEITLQNCVFGEVHNPIYKYETNYVIKRNNYKVDSKVGEIRFDFTLPTSPYSYSGDLCSISWFVQATAKKERCSYELIMAPHKEVVTISNTDKNL